MSESDGRRRVVVEGVTPDIDCGHFPIKRIVGDTVTVEADVFADGHDSLSCQLSNRRESDSAWHVVPMTPLVNDRWRGQFTVSALGIPGTAPRYSPDTASTTRSYRVGDAKGRAAS